MVLWWGRATLLAKCSVIDRPLSPWSSLGLGLSKMGNNPSRHQKKKNEKNKKGGGFHFSINDTVVDSFVQDLCFVGELMLPGKGLLDPTGLTT